MCLLPIDIVIAVFSNFELVSVTEQIDFSVNNPKDWLISRKVAQLNESKMQNCFK